MEFKGIFTVTFLAYCVQIIIAFPRDISVVNTEEIVTVIDPTEEKIRTEQTLDSTKESTEPVLEHHLHRVVSCEFEEATEDHVCQEHCLPKGYSYGLCVSHRCSCV